MAVETARASALERSWWLRAPAVLVAPRAVFISLRDESEAAVEARQEPLLAIAGLAGIAGVLSTPVARQLLNDASFSVSLIPVWAFLGGMAYAVAVYWLGGGLLYGAARRFGGLPAVESPCVVFPGVPCCCHPEGEYRPQRPGG